MTSQVGGRIPEPGRLSTVALREVWQHEALAFTPWLLDNADVLGEALHMDLELDAAEHTVGGFSLDLIGRDRLTDERIIIENQLESTDHAHLGQLLTYAGGTNPTNVVWIAAAFREEHRAALEWLNSRTDATTRFFGLVVEAVRIDDSRPAPLFRVIVQPNDWGKNIRTRAQASDGKASERAMTYANFWEAYLAAMAEAGVNWTRTQRAPAQGWFATASGTAYVVYSVAFGKQRLRSEVYFKDPRKEVNARRFEALAAMRDRLEQEYGGELSFQALDGRKACRIAAERAGDLSRKEEWPEYLAWFIDSQRRLRAAVARVGGIPQ